MPIFTATGYRDRILKYAKDHGHQIGKSKAMRLGIELARRQVRMNDLDLERILMYSDPTPRDAIRNVMREQVAA